MPAVLVVVLGAALFLAQDRTVILPIWSLVALGVVYGLWGLRHGLRQRRGLELHSHDGHVHLHSHGDHAHGHGEEHRRADLEQHGVGIGFGQQHAKAQQSCQCW